MSENREKNIYILNPNKTNYYIHKNKNGNYTKLEVQKFDQELSIRGEESFLGLKEYIDLAYNIEDIIKIRNFLNKIIVESEQVDGI